MRYPVVFFTARGLPGENRDTTDTVTAALRMLRLPGERRWLLARRSGATWLRFHAAARIQAVLPGQCTIWAPLVAHPRSQRVPPATCLCRQGAPVDVAA